MRTLVLLAAMAASQLTAATMMVKRAAAVTGAPLATRVALLTLQQGGGAVDASIAANLALSVIAPQSAGVGGGGFLLYYERATGAVWCLDFREMSPREWKAAPAVAGGPLSHAGIPGTIAGFSAAHQRFGKLPWKALFASAISLAQEGAPLDLRVRADLRERHEQADIAAHPATAALYFVDGVVLPPDAPIKNEMLARTLTRIADKPRALYEGNLGRQLVSEYQKAGAALALRELSAYKAMWRSPLRVDSGEQQTFALPPPANGGVVLAEALGVVQTLESVTKSAAGEHVIGEAIRRAQVDAQLGLGDPDRTALNLAPLLTAEHLAEVARAIEPARIAPTTALTSTSETRQGDHFSQSIVVDEQGNVALMTTSLGSRFGSGVMSSLGFFINDALHDFDSGGKGPNAPVGGRRPASPVAAALVTVSGRVRFALAPGRDDSMASVALLAMREMEKDTSTEAIQALPRFHQTLLPDEMRYEPALPAETLRALEATGRALRVQPAVGDLQLIRINGSGGIEVSADPRNGGAAGGY